LNCQKPALEYASPGRIPPVGGALPVTLILILKVVMETLLVLMVVATAGLMLAHGFAIVKRFAEGR